MSAGLKDSLPSSRRATWRAPERIASTNGVTQSDGTLPAIAVRMTPFTSPRSKERGLLTSRIHRSTRSEAIRYPSATEVAETPRETRSSAPPGGGPTRKTQPATRAPPPRRGGRPDEEYGGGYAVPAFRGLGISESRDYFRRGVPNVRGPQDERAVVRDDRPPGPLRHDHLFHAERTQSRSEGLGQVRGGSDVPAEDGRSRGNLDGGAGRGRALTGSAHPRQLLRDLRDVRGRSYPALACAVRVSLAVQVVAREEDPFPDGLPQLRRDVLDVAGVHERIVHV